MCERKARREAHGEKTMEKEKTEGGGEEEADGGRAGPAG